MVVGLRMENVITGFIIFSVLIGLSIGFYTGLSDNYSLTKGDVDADGNDIMDNLKDINVISGMDDIITAIHKIQAPTASAGDILGGLKTAGIGLLKIMTGVITLPIEILDVIIPFYTLPSELYTALGLIFVIYIGFILVNKYVEIF